MELITRSDISTDEDESRDKCECCHDGGTEHGPQAGHSGDGVVGRGGGVGRNAEGGGEAGAGKGPGENEESGYARLCSSPMHAYAG